MNTKHTAMRRAKRRRVKYLGTFKKVSFARVENNLFVLTERGVFLVREDKLYPVEVGGVTP